jgi:aminopeptidase
MSILDSTLSTYGELAVRIGLNLQPGQRLLIIGPIANGGASLEAAPLVRKVAESAYRAGARYVEALWGDEALQLARFRHAPRDSFDEFSAWLPEALLKHVQAGHAVISIYANDRSAEERAAWLVSAVQQAAARNARPFRECISRNQTNWSVIGSERELRPNGLSGEPADQRAAPLGCHPSALRLDRPDPILAWEGTAALAERRDFLNTKRCRAEVRGPAQTCR